MTGDCISIADMAGEYLHVLGRGYFGAHIYQYQALLFRFVCSRVWNEAECLGGHAALIVRLFAAGRDGEIVKDEPQVMATVHLHDLRYPGAPLWNWPDSPDEDPPLHI